MDLDAFLAPVSAANFRERHLGREPLHIPADRAAARDAIVGWDDIFDLVGVLPQWREDGLKLIVNSSPVARDHYVATRETGRGIQAQPDAGMVAALMEVGASVVMDGLEDIRTDLRGICAMLGREFAAKAGVNLYASQRGIQAFASHCDPHEVFVLQCEGEKDWRIYANRAEAPVQATMLRDQDRIEREKGDVMLAVTMRPGDLLYIPRGFYHDATARSERSLHLTFAVQPLYGTALLDLVRDLALDDPVFRQYLPSAETAPEDLAELLDRLGSRLAHLLRTPGFLEDIAVRQRTLAPAPFEPATSQEASRTWRRTQRTVKIEQPPEGSSITDGSRTRPLNYLSDAANWIIAANVLSDRQLYARFAHHPQGELRDLVDWFAEAGLIERIG